MATHTNMGTTTTPTATIIITEVMRDGPPSPPPIAPAFPAVLLAWLTPNFPVGGYAYSQGLEQAIADGVVKDATSLEAWLHAITQRGALWNDLVLAACVMRATSRAEIADIAELSLALQPSRERADEARVQGFAFAEAYRAGWAERAPLPDVGLDDLTGSLAVAFAIAARQYGFAPGQALPAFALAFQNNLVSAAIRLGAIGQFDGQRVLAALTPATIESCSRAANATLDDLGSATFAADLASLLHETLTTRLFRS